MIGRRMRVEQLVAEVLKDRIFFDESGGGVTFSGGEPLMQPEFLAQVLRACRAEQVHTALDTCGYAERDQLLDLAAMCDLVLYDLKCLDDRRHQQQTGVSNQGILDNLEALAEQHANIWIRVPLIPGLNDQPEELEAMARFVGRLRGVRQVNVLGYHALGTHKRQPAEAAEVPAGVPSPSVAQLDEAADRFRRQGLPAFVGG